MSLGSLNKIHVFLVRMLDIHVTTRPDMIVLASFEFPLEIRRIVYTGNPIENLNGKIKKYTKDKPSFSTDDIVIKSVY